MPFKIKYPEEAQKQPQVTFALWSKAELHATVKEFPNPCEDSHKITQEFRILADTYKPGPEDLYNLINSLTGPGDTQRWAKKA